VEELRRLRTRERDDHQDHWRKEEQFVSKIAAAGTGVQDTLEAIARQTPLRSAAQA
jgi:hypothetical protein